MSPRHRLVVLLGAAAALGVATLGTLFWSFTRIEPVITEAKQRGLPTTAADLDRPAITAEQQTALRNIDQLVHLTLGPLHTLEPEKPVPEWMLDRSDDLVRYAAQLDHLDTHCGETPLWLDPSDPVQAQGRHLLYVASHAEAYRLMLAKPTDVPWLCQRVINAGRRLAPVTIASLNWRQQFWTIASQIILARREHLGPETARKIAARLRADADALDTYMLAASQGNFVTDVAAGRRSLQSIERERGYELPTALTIPVIGESIWRVGYPGYLRCQMNQLDALRQGLAPILPTRPAMYCGCPSRHSTGTPTWIVSAVLSDDNVVWWWHHARPYHRARLLLAAAVLDHASWPVDPFDPGGYPLRPLHDADGRLLGAYSVGRNGTDNGGYGDDRYFAIDGPRPERLAP